MEAAYTEMRQNGLSIAPMTTDSSRTYPDYLGTTPMDEFEPKGYVLHKVSGYVWEWYSNWTHSSLYLRNAAQTKAAVLSTRTVRG
jgi:formylglycine-generating enzyme required for sulfatase activity